MSLAIGLHLITVVPALFIGIFILLAKKGTLRHKTLGKLWALLMLATAIVSFFIHGDSSLDWIYILSGITIASVLIALWAVRCGNIRIHQRFMLGTYIGVIVAGYFALMTPGRFVYKLLFGG